MAHPSLMKSQATSTTTSASLETPPAPAFSSFMFNTIGRPPTLASRIYSPPPGQSFSPSPASEPMDWKEDSSVEYMSKPSLLTRITGVDESNEADVDMIDAAPTPSDRSPESHITTTSSLPEEEDFIPLPSSDYSPSLAHPSPKLFSSQEKKSTVMTTKEEGDRQTMSIECISVDQPINKKHLPTLSTRESTANLELMYPDQYDTELFTPSPTTQTDLLCTPTLSLTKTLDSTPSLQPLSATSQPDHSSADWTHISDTDKDKLTMDTWQSLTSPIPLSMVYQEVEMQQAEWAEVRISKAETRQEEIKRWIHEWEDWKSKNAGTAAESNAAECEEDRALVVDAHGTTLAPRAGCTADGMEDVTEQAIVRDLSGLQTTTNAVEETSLVFNQERSVQRANSFHPSSAAPELASEDSIADMLIPCYGTYLEWLDPLEVEFSTPSAFPTAHVCVPTDVAPDTSEQGAPRNIDRDLKLRAKRDAERIIAEQLKVKKDQAAAAVAAPSPGNLGTSTDPQSRPDAVHAQPDDAMLQSGQVIPAASAIQTVSRSLRVNPDTQSPITQVKGKVESLKTFVPASTAVGKFYSSLLPMSSIELGSVSLKRARETHDVSGLSPPGCSGRPLVNTNNIIDGPGAGDMSNGMTRGRVKSEPQDDLTSPIPTSATDERFSEEDYRMDSLQARKRRRIRSPDLPVKVEEMEPVLPVKTCEGDIAQGNLSQTSESLPETVNGIELAPPSKSPPACPPSVVDVTGASPQKIDQYGGSDLHCHSGSSAVPAYANVSDGPPACSVVDRDWGTSGSKSRDVSVDSIREEPQQRERLASKEYSRDRSIEPLIQRVRLTSRNVSRDRSAEPRGRSGGHWSPDHVDSRNQRRYEPYARALCSPPPQPLPHWNVYRPSAERHRHNPPPHHPPRRLSPPRTWNTYRPTDNRYRRARSPSFDSVRRSCSPDPRERMSTATWSPRDSKDSRVLDTSLSRSPVRRKSLSSPMLDPPIPRADLEVTPNLRVAPSDNSPFQDDMNEKLRVQRESLEDIERSRSYLCYRTEPPVARNVNSSVSPEVKTCFPQTEGVRAELTSPRVPPLPQPPAKLQGLSWEKERNIQVPISGSRAEPQRLSWERPVDASIPPSRLTHPRHKSGERKETVGSQSYVLAASSRASWKGKTEELPAVGDIRTQGTVVASGAEDSAVSDGASAARSSPSLLSRLRNTETFSASPPYPSNSYQQSSRSVRNNNKSAAIRWSGEKQPPSAPASSNNKARFVDQAPEQPPVARATLADRIDLHSIHPEPSGTHFRADPRRGSGAFRGQSQSRQPLANDSRWRPPVDNRRSPLSLAKRLSGNQTWRPPSLEDRIS